MIEQGTLVALAALSEGKVSEKLKSATLLSPVAYLSHMTTPLGILLANTFAGEVVPDLTSYPYLIAFFILLVPKL